MQDHSRCEQINDNVNLLQAFEYGIQYPQYIFLFYGWYSSNWWVGTEEEQDLLGNMSAFSDCTAEQRASVVPYSLAPLQAEFLEDQNKSTIISSGIVSLKSMQTMIHPK